MWKIQDYAILGNCRSAALVSKGGSIDWLCWPRFDSEPICSRLLDPSKAHWSIFPASQSFQIHRSYIEKTCLLKTVFSSGENVVELTDCMAVVSSQQAKNFLWPEHEIVRKLECIEGEMELQFEFFMEREADKSVLKDSHSFVSWFLPGGGLILYAPIKLMAYANSLNATWTITKGQTLYFSVSFDQEWPYLIPSGNSCCLAMENTEFWWRSFSSQITYKGPYRRLLIQSAIVLKLMKYSPSGAIIAAPTTSLPEKIQDDANWDYRYCWLRDASMATHALVNLNLKEEAGEFVNWILHSTVLSRPQLKVLYTVFGGQPPPENIQEEFQGYLNSRPVRFGNAAMTQNQMDLYGEVIHSAYLVLKDEKKIDHETQSLLIDLGHYICAHWQEDDAGMWEVRGRKEHFTHSLLMCWTGAHYLLELYRLGLIKKINAPLLKNTEEKISQVIHQLAWNEELQSFTSQLRGHQVDANLLLMSWYGFLPFDSLQMRQTYERIRMDLGTDQGLFYRNRKQEEGAFVLCSFWAVEYLARGGGTLTEAKNLFGDVLAYANDVGLWSEEIDPATGDFLGNYPLTFSHLGFINAVLAIDRREKKETSSENRKEVHYELG